MDKEGWTTVDNTRRNLGKGKEIMRVQQSASFTVGEILCQNGFESLRNENGPDVVLDKVP